MSKRKKDPAYFRRERLLARLGKQLKLARRRRGITMETVAREAGVSRSTIWSIERGSGGISLGILIRVLSVYGLEEEVLRIASDDPEGRKLQDRALIPSRKTKNRQRES